MPRAAYRLIPREGGGFHLGREGLAQEAAAEVFPSDSLFAALVATMARIWPSDEVTNFCNEFLHTQPPPLRLSSVFPYVGETLLLPKPLLPYDQLDTKLSSADLGKTFKKLKYVSSTVMQHLLNGGSLTELLHGDNMVQGGDVLLAPDEVKTLPNVRNGQYWHTGPVPRVSLDRVTTASNIYQAARTVFAPGCGLWFLADMENELKQLLDTLLEILADSGIGGDRSSGYGAFSAEEVAPPELPAVEGHQQAVSLSRYNPTRDEISKDVLGDGAYYELIDVGGYLYSTLVPGQRRQRVRMIEAGAVLNVSGIIPCGRLVDVRPESAPAPPLHPVYRSGIALLAGMKARRQDA